MKDLQAMGGRVVHVSFSVEALTPKFAPKTEAIRCAVAALLGIDPARIGLTATTGEGLTDCGRGLGISVLCVLTAEVPA